MHRVFIAALAGVLLMAVSPAEAQPNYPAIVQDALGAVRKPPCKVCHADGITGFGTVTTNFGKTMLSKGAKAYDEESLRAALFGLVLYPKKPYSNPYREAPDDAEVLRRGGDPNDLDPVYYIEDPQYGCGGAMFTGRAGANWGGPGLLALCLVLAVRRGLSSRRR